ncbi:MAG: TonB-dependent receptor [Calditrichia bacterium]
MKQRHNLLTAVFTLLLATGFLVAQDVVLTGQVKGADGSLLAGVNVVESGTQNGTTTDSDGAFSFKVASLPATLVFSYVGYATQSVTATNDSYVYVTLAEDAIAGESVTTVGSRFRPRTSITSPVPIDNIDIRELEATAQVSFDKMMHYSVPSFNSTQQTISDATAHFDPADLRGLGPSRTLVLINGKRKNASSLVYINDTPGKGDVGVDMGSIPVGSIKRIEVLRDGASAQYGSDAIAGVINVILADETEKTTINAFSGITEEGDGFQYGAHLNTGKNFDNKGFINFTASFSDQEETNRAGEPGDDQLFGVDGTDPFIMANPDLGMTVGLPNLTKGSGYLNSAYKVNETDEIYGFGGVVLRKGESYALYRTPYWIPDPNNLLHEAGTEYQGFQPTFDTDVLDVSGSAGYRGNRSGWNYDLSYSFGMNSVDYNIGNTLNPALGADSPTEFDAGGYEFANNIVNVDASRQLSEQIFASVGGEFRQEKFVANAGEEASYTGGGAQSFPGLQPQNEVDATRTNFGAYLDLGADVTPDFYVGGAVRFENYSDFGTSTTFKAAARYKSPLNSFSVRGSFSTGFRAPSLHQINLSNIQTLVSGGTVSNQGTFDNTSPILRELGVAELKEEESINFTFGFAARPSQNVNISADVFQIDVDDRIIFSSSIANSDPTTTVGAILDANSITSLKFFINAVNSRTRGLDLVGNYSKDGLRFNAAASFYDHSIEGQINTPSVLAADGADIFDRKEQSRILSARPNQKVILGVSYDLAAVPLTVGVSGTYFGEVTWQHASDPTLDQTFAGKPIFDLNASYAFSNQISLSLLVNNIAGTYPDEIETGGDVVTDLGGRFRYPWEVNQFGFNGRVILGALNLSF